MKPYYLRRISLETLSSDNLNTLKAKSSEIIENIIKTKLNLVELDITKSFASLGCTPDQWNEIITAINSTLSIELPVETEYLTPADLITAVAALLTEPVIAKEVFDSCIHDADKLLMDLESMTDTSVEGLGTDLKRTFILATDVFRKMCNSFKTSVFRFYKDTKRSEMRMFYEGNRGKVSTVESANYATFMNIHADTPTGMRATMMEGVKSVNEVYTSLDIYPFMETAQKYLNDALLAISREQNHTPTFSDILMSIKKRQDVLKQLAKDQVKIFTNDKIVYETLFKDVYSNMGEFKAVRESLLTLQSRIDETNRLDNSLNDMDKTLSDITAIVESDEQISKDFIAGVLTITKYLSEACSFYGENVAYQLALEHNHILNIQSCWMALK